MTAHRKLSEDDGRAGAAARRALSHPGAYLATYFVLVALLAADTFRRPDQQLSAKAYTEAVELYQEHGHLVLRGQVRCRHVPSCSHYSIESVERHGIREGLRLSFERIHRCTNSVPMGTLDPVPVQSGSEQ